VQDVHVQFVQDPHVQLISGILTGAEQFLDQHFFFLTRLSADFTNNAIERAYSQAFVPGYGHMHFLAIGTT